MQNAIHQLETLFHPRSVAVIGASPNAAAPQGRAFTSLIGNGFTGKVFAVNPNYESIHGHTCFARLADIPQEVDIAVIAVAAAKTLNVLEECVQKGVKNAIILTSGFAETSASGRKMEERMAALADKSGMRIMGPNCVGLINNLNGLWANFATPVQQACLLYPHAFDLISQSGFFGMAIYQTILEQGIGFSRYASIGNQADLTFSEIMQYLIDDGHSRIIGGYIEGLKDGQVFLQAAKSALEKGKLILVMKAGRSGAGAKAALSHTGSMAGSDESYDALFRQAGVVRAESIGQFTDFLSLAVHGRWPKGNRVAILSASGGGAVILTDQCTQHGLEIADLEPGTQDTLESILPSFSVSRNPVDLTSQFVTEPGILCECLRALAADPNVDAVVLSVHMLASLIQPALAEIIQISGKTEKPVLFVGRLLGAHDVVAEMEKQILKAGIPLIRDEHNAIWALSSLVCWQEKVARHKRSFCFPREETTVERLALPRGPAVLTEHKAMQVLSAYGINCAAGAVALTVEDALEAAERLGYPVALKVQSPDILHKTDAGCLCLNVDNEVHLRTAYQALLGRTGREQPFAVLEGILVQRMVPEGIETIIGMKRDPQLGPVIMFGMGGILAEAIDSVTLRIAPLDKYDAEEMLEEIRFKKLLQGKRGRPGADKKAIVEALLRVSDLAMQNPEIGEIEMNPFIVYEQGKGGVAADAVMILSD